VRKNVLGEFSGFTLNYEENCLGGIGIYSFLEFWVRFHVKVLRRGDSIVFILGVLSQFLL
jgi:hypothetical protein